MWSVTILSMKLKKLNHNISSYLGHIQNSFELKESKNNSLFRYKPLRYKDGKGWRRLTRIADDKLERFRRHFLRCSCHEVTPLSNTCQLLFAGFNRGSKAATRHTGGLEICPACDCRHQRQISWCGASLRWLTRKISNITHVRYWGKRKKNSTTTLCFFMRISRRKEYFKNKPEAAIFKRI